MPGSFTVQSHTADTAITVEADTLEELFEWAAAGMFSLMYELDAVEPERYELVQAEGSHSDLLVDVLSELLYLSEAEDLVPCTFVAEARGPNRVRLRVGAAAAEPSLLIGPPIKAVTYHELSVEQLADGSWTATVVFDV